jgi:hypothetical protein
MREPSNQPLSLDYSNALSLMVLRILLLLSIIFFGLVLCVLETMPGNRWWLVPTILRYCKPLLLLQKTISTLSIIKSIRGSHHGYAQSRHNVNIFLHRHYYLLVPCFEASPHDRHQWPVLQNTCHLAVHIYCWFQNLLE